MKTRLSFIQALVFTSLSVLYGQEEMGIQKRNRNETALLEELKEYIKEDKSGNDSRVWKIAQELASVGSTNVVQLFLDNIAWKSHEGRRDSLRRITPDTPPDYPMYRALLKIKDVPLHQCMVTLKGTLLKQMNVGLRDEKKESFNLFWAETLQMGITYEIHGEKFIRELESLAETLPNVEQRKSVKQRAEEYRRSLQLRADQK
ncbi:MAG: hypothetical protein FWG50_12740 [Kiritimatiellaeota bacterium]|nr:hypothetical protein [Kiritimatiellota bacterium]